MIDDQILSICNTPQEESSKKRNKKMLQSQVRELLQKDNLCNLEIECGNHNVMRVYEPIFNSKFLENPNLECFKLLCSRRVCFEVCSYIHTGSIKYKDLALTELFELLHFCNEMDCFQKLKAKVGVELEERIPILKEKQLGECILFLHERGLEQCRNWLLFYFKRLDVTREAMAELNFPDKLFAELFFVKKDKHLSEIFWDVLNEEETAISVVKSEDECRDFSEVMEKLWKEREVSGDYLVSSADGKERKFHKIVLNCLPFFLVQSTTQLKKNSHSHTTNFSSHTFQSFIEWIYTGNTHQIRVQEAIEILDKIEELYFYFAETESQNVNVEKKKRLHFSILTVSVKDFLNNLVEFANSKLWDINLLSSEEDCACLRVLLFAIENEAFDLQSRCMEILHKSPHLIDNVGNVFQRSQDIEKIFKFTFKFLTSRKTLPNKSTL